MNLAQAIQTDGFVTGTHFIRRRMWKRTKRALGRVGSSFAWVPESLSMVMLWSPALEDAMASDWEAVPAIDVLVVHAKASDPKVRIGALEWLQKVNGPPGIFRILAEMDKDAAVRATARTFLNEVAVAGAE